MFECWCVQSCAEFPAAGICPRKRASWKVQHRRAWPAKRPKRSYSWVLKDGFSTDQQQGLHNKFGSTFPAAKRGDAHQPDGESYCRAKTLFKGDHALHSTHHQSLAFRGSRAVQGLWCASRNAKDIYKESSRESKRRAAMPLGFRRRVPRHERC